MERSKLARLTLQKTCELGTEYVDLEKEKNQLQLDLEVAKNDLTCTQTELKIVQDIVKKALEYKDEELTEAEKVAREKTEAAEKKFASQ
ncbi:hypothetical protein D1007_52550 [Hordeum vulgare]|nr:hypothetical protein D1007_52550 [Hordeum vulgare]